MCIIITHRLLERQAVIDDPAAPMTPHSHHCHSQGPVTRAAAAIHRASRCPLHRQRQRSNCTASCNGASSCTLGIGGSLDACAARCRCQLPAPQHPAPTARSRAKTSIPSSRGRRSSFWLDLAREPLWGGIRNSACKCFMPLCSTQLNSSW